MLQMEVITGSATAPDTTLTAVSMYSGNTNTIRDFKKGRAAIIDGWYKSQASGGGLLRVRSAKSEPTQGIRLPVLQNDPRSLFSRGQFQPVNANDIMTIEVSGSATASDLEITSLLVAYTDFQGSVNPNFIDYATLMNARVPSQKILQTMEIALSLGTSGGYSGSAALSTATHALKPNTRYALLGYYCSAVCATIRLQGTDFGNLAIGAPGTTVRELTQSYWLNLALNLGMPLIPTFNSINLAQLLIDGAQDENGTDVTVELLVAELQ